MYCAGNNVQVFQPDDGAQGSSSHKPSEIAEETPRSYGINTYTDEEIRKSKGLNQEFRRFWNEKAAELCRDRSVRGKLQNKVAIQGAIYTSWTLHKTSLLQIKAEQVQEEARKAYRDEIALSHLLTPIISNLERMQSAHAMVTHTYKTISDSSCSDQMKAEKELEEEMHELRKAQDALSTAIERRQSDLQKIEKAEQGTLQLATSPVKISDKEVEHLVKQIENESQMMDFED